MRSLKNKMACLVFPDAIAMLRHMNAGHAVGSEASRMRRTGSRRVLCWSRRCTRSMHWWQRQGKGGGDMGRQRRCRVLIELPLRSPLPFFMILD